MVKGKGFMRGKMRVGGEWKERVGREGRGILRWDETGESGYGR